MIAERGNDGIWTAREFRDGKMYIGRGLDRGSAWRCLIEEIRNSVYEARKMNREKRSQ